jgi:WhiB family redox-sensing transcriptional regulator
VTPTDLDDLVRLLAPPPGLDMSWQDQALCAETDPEAFYPGKGQTPEQALAVCDRCEVRTACLEYALAARERYGVWGGTTQDERRTMWNETEDEEYAA